MVNKRLKGFKERHALFLVFVLLAVLVLGSLFIAKPKITGFAVIEGYDNQLDCEDVEVGGVWYEEVCYDEHPVCGLDFLELCDETNCVDVGLGFWYDDVCNAEEEPSCRNHIR